MYEHNEKSSADNVFIATQWLPAARYLAILLVLMSAIIFGIRIFTKDTTQIIAVEELTQAPDAITEQVEADKLSPGMHIYDSLNNYYVLLTFGETCGYVMNVMPNATEDSVHFAVSAEEVASTVIEPVWRLYKVGTAAISADEGTLKNLGYGVGSRGLNIGYVQKTHNSGEYFITPLLDTAPNDRLFRAEGSAELSSGLFYYEYTIRSGGAFVTACEPLEDYPVSAQVGDIKATEQNATLMVGDEKVSFLIDTASLTEEDIAYMQSAKEQGSSINVLIANKGEKASAVGIIYPGMSAGDVNIEASKTDSVNEYTIEDADSQLTPPAQEQQNTPDVSTLLDDTLQTDTEVTGNE